MKIETRRAASVSDRSYSVNDSGNLLRRAQRDPALVRWGLTLTAFSIVGVLIVVPVIHVFVEAFGHGPRAYFAAALVLTAPISHSTSVSIRNRSTASQKSPSPALRQMLPLHDKINESAGP